MLADSLRILQVCSASQLIYGAAHSLMTLARAQREVGKEIEFVTRSGKKFGDQVRRENFKVYEVPSRIKIDPLAILRMRKIIREGRFDLVHTHLSTSSVNGCLAARFAKTPSIATVHGMSGKGSFMAATHMIGVSEQVKEHLIKQGVAADRVSVVYNGLDPRPEVSKSNARIFLEIPEDALVVGTVARVTAMKGIDDALLAFAALAPEFPNLMYLVVGDGDALADCKALAAELGIEDRVRFVGYQNNVSYYLAAMDLFLFPSLKEAMGIALAEAMAAGLPTVSTDIGGIPEVLGTGCGIMVPVRSPEKLADASRRLLRDSTLRSEMASAARIRSNKVFSATAMERSTDWVYREVLGLGLPLPHDEASAVQLSA